MTQPNRSRSKSKTAGSLDQLSHGYAPKTAPPPPPPEPLEDVVGGVVQSVSAAARAEIRLLEARAAIAKQGIQSASIWGFVAASAFVVALLALAIGAILILATKMGPLWATLIVFAALLLLAAFAGFRARRGAADVSAAFQMNLFPDGAEEDSE